MRFDHNETYASALKKIERRHELTTWIGAAYAGYVALLATAPGARLPPLVSAVILTLLIAGAGLLAYARVNFAYYVTVLSREIDAGRLAPQSPLAAPHAEWPQPAEKAYRATLLLIVVIGALLVLGAWQAAIECTWPTRALLKLYAHCAA